MCDILISFISYKLMKLNISNLEKGVKSNKPTME